MTRKEIQLKERNDNFPRMNASHKHTWSWIKRSGEQVEISVGLSTKQSTSTHRA